jgi:hypothetical protein
MATTDQQKACELASQLTQTLVTAKVLPVSCENAQQVAQQMAETFKIIYAVMRDPEKQ